MKRIILYLMLLLIFVGNAEAVEPFDTQAGMAAYVNVGSLNLVDATGAFTQLNSLSTAHAVGSINIPNLVGSNIVNVYVDTDGWIAAYISRSEDVGNIFQWYGIDFENPKVNTTLEDAIRTVTDEMGFDYSFISGNVRYYDFEHPEATNLLIFMNTIQYGYNTNDYSHVYIPENYTIYSMGYSHYYDGLYETGYIYTRYKKSAVYLDGIRVSWSGDYPESNGININSYHPNSLTKNITHSIGLETINDPYSSNAGVANIFVFK